ncbi:MAG TPA: hypothetical protein VLJ88_08585 [Propionibacteriaceae bacterium]|nr:hypothetical protein [Propionibacteriaceae bacterium]
MVEGDTAVARVGVPYGEPVRLEYRDRWLLSFADDGRVREFEEWAYWPASRTRRKLISQGATPWTSRDTHR